MRTGDGSYRMTWRYGIQLPRQRAEGAGDGLQRATRHGWSGLTVPVEPGDHDTGDEQMGMKESLFTPVKKIRSRSDRQGFIRPEPVDVAVRPCTDLPVQSRKDRPRSFACLQVLHMSFGPGDHLDPLDVVIWFHRVIDGANNDGDSICTLLNDGHMLLVGGVDSILSLFYHRLFAADELSLALVDDGHDLPAVSTLIDLEHFSSLSSSR